ncbi:MAG: hypothetical protein ACRDQ4_25270 [Pseudonocardiaceae bacterium]
MSASEPLSPSYEELAALVVGLSAQLERAHARIAELEARLGRLMSSGECTTAKRSCGVTIRTVPDRFGHGMRDVQTATGSAVRVPEAAPAVAALEAGSAR